MRHLAMYLAVALLAGLVIMPGAQGASSTNPPATRPVGSVLREVDHRIDVCIRAMKAAEQIADERHLRGIDAVLDQGLRMAHEADGKLDQVLAIVRGLIAQDKPPRADLERAERLLDEALVLTHQAEERIDLALKHRPEDAQRLARDLKVADSNADAAIRMLRRIIERL